MGLNGTATDLSRDLAAVAERRLEEVRAELERARNRRLAIDTQVSQLDREEDQLVALLATYRGEPLSLRPKRPTSPPVRRATPQDVLDLLASLDKPAHYREIEAELRTRGLDTGGGQDPANALLATYFNDPRLERVARGTYRLRGLKQDSPVASATSDNAGSSPGPLVPAFASVAGGDPLRDFLQSPEFVALRNTTERFLAVLSCAHKIDAGRFERVLELRGTTRLYFARSREEILRSGKSTDPKAIPGTPFWVLCNESDDTKATRLQDALLKIGFRREIAVEAAAAIGG